MIELGEDSNMCNHVISDDAHKYKCMYHDYKKIKDAKLKITTENNITQAYLFLNGVWLLVCVTSNRRRVLFSTVYSYLKYDLNVCNIIECGIGLGEIIDPIKKIGVDYKIVEINKHLYDMFKNKCDIIHDDYYEYIKTLKNISNTVFIERNITTSFKTVHDLIKHIVKNYSQHIGNTNYICIECSEIKGLDVVKSFDHKYKNIFTYIIKI